MAGLPPLPPSPPSPPKTNFVPPSLLSFSSQLPAPLSDDNEKQNVVDPPLKRCPSVPASSSALSSSISQEGKRSPRGPLQQTQTEPKQTGRSTSPKVGRKGSESVKSIFSSLQRPVTTFSSPRKFSSDPIPNSPSTSSPLPIGLPPTSSTTSSTSSTTTSSPSLPSEQTHTTTRKKSHRGNRDVCFEEDVDEGEKMKREREKEREKDGDDGVAEEEEGGEKVKRERDKRGRRNFFSDMVTKLPGAKSEHRSTSPTTRPTQPSHTEDMFSRVKSERIFLDSDGSSCSPSSSSMLPSSASSSPLHASLSPLLHSSSLSPSGSPQLSLSYPDTGKRLAIVLYDFGGLSCDDYTYFSVRSGDELSVLTTTHNKLYGWYKCECEGQIFFLPSNYLVPKTDEQHNSFLSPVTPKNKKATKRSRKSQKFGNTFFNKDDEKKTRAASNSVGSGSGMKSSLPHNTTKQQTTHMKPKKPKEDRRVSLPAGLESSIHQS